MTDVEVRLPAPARTPADLGFGAVAPFLGITFALAWGIFAVLLAFPEAVEAAFGPVRAANPLFFLAVYAPAIAAFVLVLRGGGLAGLSRYLGRLLLWRIPGPWLLYVLAVIPAVYLAAAILLRAPWTDEHTPSTPGALLVAIGFMLILGPVEEFGWRGVLQPLLQRKVAPIWAGLAVGLVWGLWHLPAFALSGTPQHGWDFVPFLVGSVAVAVILTPLFNATGGSILWSALYHFQLNNPLWPDAQPLDMYLFAAVAVVVAWLNRDTMFRLEGAVVTVVPPPARNEGAA